MLLRACLRRSRLACGAFRNGQPPLANERASGNLLGSSVSSQVRSALSWALKALSPFSAPEGERRIGDVKWHDEFAWLGDCAEETHRHMVEEDKKLRSSQIFQSPLRRTVFNELIRHRKQFRKARSSA
jgi:hypothetical protein